MENTEALVDKIASFFEREENWTALKYCWLENDRSEDLRKLLRAALTEWFILMENNNKIWCEEYQDYYGNSDPDYGGVLTDLRTLPEGKEFFVANGWWEGKILSNNKILIYAPDGEKVAELTDKYHSLYLR